MQTNVCNVIIYYMKLNFKINFFDRISLQLIYVIIYNFHFYFYLRFFITFISYLISYLICSSHSFNISLDFKWIIYLLVITYYYENYEMNIFNILNSIFIFMISHPFNEIFSLFQLHFILHHFIITIKRKNSNLIFLSIKNIFGIWN